jgi:hypothetical protein
MGVACIGVMRYSMMKCNVQEKLLHIPSKRWYLSTTLTCVTSQNLILLKKFLPATLMVLFSSTQKLLTITILDVMHLLSVIKNTMSRKRNSVSVFW